MTYTDKYLIHDISNKVFKHKYRVQNVKSKVVAYKADNNASNRENWMQRIMGKNPWLKEPEPIFDSL